MPTARQPARRRAGTVSCPACSAEHRSCEHRPLSLLAWFKGLFGAPTVPLDPDTWLRVRARLPWANSLAPERDARLCALTALFLRSKAITPVEGLDLEPDDRVLLAALCCLPLIEFGKEGLRGWSQLIVYPDTIRIERRYDDVYEPETLDVAHEWTDEVDGEAWENGPLLLSWADILEELRDPRGGGCLPVHEMAHKLDMLDGALDGTPPLPREWQRQWAQDFQRAYETFVQRVDRGRRVRLDVQAADSPDEFFAVCSECHFTRPEVLRRDMPEVAAHLSRFYGDFALGG